MIKLEGKDYVDSFLYKLRSGADIYNDYFFGINLKEKNSHKFEMEKLYLNMIKQAKSELKITMAYFSCLKPFIDEIVNAQKRGVNVTIMIPEHANFQDDTNKKTVKTLLKRTNNQINVYFSPKMIHTKMIINDDYISIGSTNITKKAFNQLDELNLFIKNINSEIKYKLDENIKENYAKARKINDYKEIKYNKARSSIESLLI